MAAECCARRGGKDCALTCLASCSGRACLIQVRIMREAKCYDALILDDGRLCSGRNEDAQDKGGKRRSNGRQRKEVNRFYSGRPRESKSCMIGRLLSPTPRPFSGRLARHCCTPSGLYDSRIGISLSYTNTCCENCWSLLKRFIV